jgi:hypothetical protein
MRPRAIPTLAAACGIFVCFLAMTLDAQGQSISGRVIDAQSSRPMAAVLIRLVDDSEESRSTTSTDQLGRYRVSVPGLGLYRVRVEQLGYLSQDSDTIEIRSVADSLTVDVRMRPTPIPIQGVQVDADRVNRRLREFFGMSIGQLRIKPIRQAMIQDFVVRGSNLSEMIDAQPIPNLQVLRSREGPCYQFRGRGCLPVYLDGARLNRRSPNELPLEMLATAIVLLPNEVIAYPEGAVHLFSIGFMR